MKKTVLYVGLAILLGTVTMVAPLALLKDNNPFSDYTYNNNETMGLDSTSGDFSVLAPSEPDPKESDVLPEEPQVTADVTSTDLSTDLSPVAFITVPSFLVALGVFVLLRRQAF
jgi:hypothetical protein